MTVTLTKVAGQWILRGAGRDDWSRLPCWPAGVETIGRCAHPRASREFLDEAERMAAAALDTAKATR